MLELFIFLTVVWFIFMVYLSHAKGERIDKISIKLSSYFDYFGDDIEEISRFLKKVAHILVFTVFTVLYCETIKLAALPIWSLSLVYIFTVIDEATKPLVKGRCFSLYDVILNVTGVVIGMLIIMVV